MMNWQRIVHLDPYLAGSIAARGWEWWDETTAESEADSVKLESEQRGKFLAGWQCELEERERERKEQQARELNQLLDTCSDGYDPAARTSWKNFP